MGRRVNNSTPGSTARCTGSPQNCRVPVKNSPMASTTPELPMITIRLSGRAPRPASNTEATSADNGAQAQVPRPWIWAG